MKTLENLLDIVKNGERGNIEFKEFLSRELHLRKNRKESLASQMKYRLNLGQGKAIYIIGVKDDGSLKGIPREKMKESLEVLEEIAREVDLHITEKEFFQGERGIICRAVVERRRLEKEHLLIATAGHVDHGKSTLVGTLISGELDDGRGKTRVFLDTLKHELERGLSAELSYGVYGFTSTGEVIHLKNPLSKRSRAEVVERANKLVSFVDTVGHEPWLRTTIRGIVGQNLDYGLLVIAADEGITSITREHLGILLAMDLPVIIAITKADRAKNLESLLQDIDSLLALVGRVSKKINTREDVELVAGFSNLQILVPVVITSAKTGQGLDLLHHLFYRLPKRASRKELEGDFLLYIDKTYNIPGVGVVVSGSVKRGTAKVGDILYLGPDEQGKFHRVKVTSIEMHYYSLNRARVGEVVGVAVKGFQGKITRGMVLSKKEPKAVKSFEASVYILNHPTRIGKGYEPVVHIETIAEVVKVEPLDREFLAAGDKGLVRMSFKYRSYYVEEGMKLIFREGRSKGIGVVTRVLS